MSVFSRARARMLVCCVASVAALGALVLAPAAGAFKIGGTYLALGDSLAYGYHQAQFQEELAKTGTITPANFNDGYVDDFGATLKLLGPIVGTKSVTTINEGCPGETTETFLNGSGVPGFCAGGATNPKGLFPDFFLHHPYTHSSQMADALAILAENPNVSPITLNIGSNDVLQFLETKCGFPAGDTCTEAQVIAEYEHITANVSIILGKLRAAAPKAQIVLIGAYNPFPTVIAGGDQQLAKLAQLLAGAASKVPGTSFANSEPPFNPASVFTSLPESADIPTVCAFTAMCPGGTFNPASPQADIHPTKLGYGVMAGVVSLAFLTH
jgi:lysophospholipase L1-like esterase